MTHAGSTSMARYFLIDRGKAISVATLGGMLGIMFLPKIIVNLDSYFNFKTLWFLTTLTLLILIPIIYFILHNQKSRDSVLQKNIDNEKTHKSWTITEILKDRVFFIYFPLASAFPFIGTGLMFHQIYIFDAKGWTMEMLGNGYIYFGLFSILGLLIGGPLIDKINTKKAIPFVLLPLLFCITCLLYTSDAADEL